MSMNNIINLTEKITSIFSNLSSGIFSKISLFLSFYGFLLLSKKRFKFDLPRIKWKN